jgi:hypothetical protein
LAAPELEIRNQKCGASQSEIRNQKLEIGCSIRKSFISLQKKV